MHSAPYPPTSSPGCHYFRNISYPRARDTCITWTNSSYCHLPSANQLSSSLSSMARPSSTLNAMVLDKRPISAPSLDSPPPICLMYTHRLRVNGTFTGLGDCLRSLNRLSASAPVSFHFPSEHVSWPSSISGCLSSPLMFSPLTIR